MTIHYIQPYAIDKNIGKAYNDEIKLIRHGLLGRDLSEHWVCITDQDTMYLLPETKATIFDTVKYHKHTYSLLTCYTNRLNYGYQLHNGVRSDETDMQKHIDIARFRHQQYYTRVQPYPHIVAGMFMLFPLALTPYVQFAENTPYFDEKFTADIRAFGGKVGIMDGVYIFHLYRWGQTNPGEHFDHLKPTTNVR